MNSSNFDWGSISIHIGDNVLPVVGIDYGLNTDEGSECFFYKDEKEFQEYLKKRINYLDIRNYKKISKKIGTYIEFDDGKKPVEKKMTNYEDFMKSRKNNI